MYGKELTIDCKNCTFFKVDEHANFICNWGKSKKKKKLTKGREDIKCKLKKRNFQKR